MIHSRDIVKERTFVSGICANHNAQIAMGYSTLLQYDPLTTCLRFAHELEMCPQCNPHFERGILPEDFHAPPRRRNSAAVMAAPTPRKPKARQKHPKMYVHSGPVEERTEPCPSCERPAKVTYEEHSETKEVLCKICDYYKSLHEHEVVHPQFKQSCPICRQHEQQQRQQEDDDVEEVIEGVIEDKDEVKEKEEQTDEASVTSKEESNIVPAVPKKKGWRLW
jgi:hypothetical protein